MPRLNGRSQGSKGMDRQQSISGITVDTMSSMAHVQYINTYLDALPANKNSYRTNTIIYGKMLRGIALNSNQTLSLKEITESKLALSRTLQLWGRHGNKNWTCEETSGMYFTLTFRRKQADGPMAAQP